MCFDDLKRLVTSNISSASMTVIEKTSAARRAVVRVASARGLDETSSR